VLLAKITDPLPNHDKFAVAQKAVPVFLSSGTEVPKGSLMFTAQIAEQIAHADH
jgi:hypothetical protein